MSLCPAGLRVRVLTIGAYRLQEQQYTSIQQVFTDLKLVFLNGQEYHNKSSEGVQPLLELETFCV